MRILLINGSPRVNGNTTTFLKLLESEFQIDEGVECVTRNLAQLKIEYCHGCRVCFNYPEEKCPNKDELLSLTSEMMKADAIIIGCPVYVEGVPGLTKNFIDRMAFGCHRPFLMGKPVYVFTSSGKGASKKAVNTLKNAVVSWGGRIIGSDNYSMGQRMEEPEAKSKYSKKVTTIVKRIYDNWLKRKISIFSLIAFYLQKQNWLQEKSRVHETDYSYWLNNGWLDKKIYYYTLDKVPMGKRVVAGICGELISKLFMK